MEKILSIVNSFLTKVLPLDKSHHLITGLVLFTGLHFFLHPAIAFSVVVAAGIAKEVVIDINAKDLHTSDALDAAATSVGGFIGLLCTL